MAATSDTVPALSQLFLRGWEARRKVDTCELTSASPEHSSCVSDGMASLERATEMANQLSLFSDNEQLDEVATSNLKYLLLPALLGELTLQSTESERMGVILKARVYFVDYLRRCWSYGLTKDNPPPPSVPPSDSAPSGPAPSGPAGRGTTGSQRRSYEQLASERAIKIQRLRERKELERRTEELTAALNRGGRGWGEGEEEGREAWVSLLQLHVYRSQEFVKSIKEEVLILRHMESVRKGEVPVAKKQGGASGSGPAQALSRQPMKPLVITREMLRGEVFGAGYPSVPTMTVEEFYQQRYEQERDKPGAVAGERGGEEGEGEKEKGEEEEEESEASVKKAREWDEFKDENRRGWGNRKNMG